MRNEPLEPADDKLAAILRELQSIRTRVEEEATVNAGFRARFEEEVRANVGLRARVEEEASANAGFRARFEEEAAANAEFRKDMRTTLRSHAVVMNRIEKSVWKAVAESAERDALLADRIDAIEARQQPDR